MKRSRSKLFLTIFLTVIATVDSRSFRLNDEANLNVFDRDFALTQIQAFEDDKSKSRRISPEMWQSRSWTEKAMERAGGLLRSQL